MGNNGYWKLLASSLLFNYSISSKQQKPYRQCCCHGDNKTTPNINNLLSKLQQYFIWPITCAHAFIIVIYAFFELIKTYASHVDKINQAADAEGCISNWSNQNDWDYKKRNLDQKITDSNPHIWEFILLIPDFLAESPKANKNWQKR